MIIKRKMIAMISLIALLGSSFTVPVLGITGTPLIERQGVTVTSGQVVDLTSDTAANTVLGLTEGTIVMEYSSNSSASYQSLFSVSNTTSGNQNRHFHVYITPSGNLGMELRNTDSIFKYTMSATAAVTPGTTNRIAFKADKTSKNYKLFANGIEVATLSKTNFKFFSDITGLNNISLGGTVRQGAVAYPFGGTISSCKIYGTPLTDAELISITNNSTTGLLLDKSNVNVTPGSVVSLDTEVNAAQLKSLTKGTFVISYTSTSDADCQSLISIGNNTTGNQDRHFHVYITKTGALGMELRNTDSVFKYTLSRPAALRGKYKGQRAMNTIAFKADPVNMQYKIFANGLLVATLNTNAYKFISNITGVNNVSLGGTIRQGSVAYPFGGVINNIKVYGDVLSDDELLTTTAATTYGKEIFYPGDATNSNYFRIPTLLKLSTGTVVSSIDARYGGTHDAKSNIDIAFSKSADGGVTWTQPTLPMKFDDYASEQVEWPRDSVGKNVQITGSASFIDSVLLEDSSNGRLYLFADAMPAGIGFSNTAAGSGFKTINGVKYLKLHWNQDIAGSYNYTVRENGVIYNDVTNTPTTYSVDENYNIKQNNTYLTQKQYHGYFTGTTLIEEINNVDVNMNVFYKDSLFKVLPTNYLVMKYSDNEGQTWSGLKLMSTFKQDTERVPLFGPGVGTQIKNGTYAGRLIISMYSSITGEFGFFYSDNHGTSWQYVTTSLGSSGSFAEAQIVEMPDGTLKTYMRTNQSKIAVITSNDGGMTWSTLEFVPGMTAASYGTQLSVINYSGLVDGKPAIMLSAPMATSGRRDGRIWIGLITDTGATGYGKYSIEWKYSFQVDTPNYGYAYSCLAEMPNGEVGVLYEKYDSWSRDELHLKNILKFERYTTTELKQLP